MEEQSTETFNGLFKDDIGDRNRCTISKHCINTGNTPLIASRNHRIPINWVIEIDQGTKNSWNQKKTDQPKAIGAHALCQYRKKTVVFEFV